MFSNRGFVGRLFMKSKTLKISGMTCVSCENRIERKLQSTEGIFDAKVSYTSRIADVTYDENVINVNKIISAIEQLDYKVIESLSFCDKKPIRKNGVSKIIGVSIILLALYMIINRFGTFNIFNAFPQAEEGTGYGMLFVIGLLTSLHCVAMCGGINLSQCVPHSPHNINESSRKNMKSALTPSFLYNFGRVISYTVVGGIVGAVGSVISFSGLMKGIVQLAAGVFMVIMGLNMLNIFPWLRKLNPRMPKISARKINAQKTNKSPFYIGLLNGLMPCGPLQAMQLYALSTGSPIKGAISMLLFSLGTVPLMFGLGAISSLLSKKFTHKMMTVSAVLVVVLGVSMFSSGMSLSGFSLPTMAIGNNTDRQEKNEAKVNDNIQTVTTKLSSGRYEPITVKKGISVKWIIKAEKKDINGCNNEIYIPKYNIEKKLEVGDNIIEFTPTESGTFAYSCWMGMIRSKITVVDNMTNDNSAGTDSSEKNSDYRIPVDKIAIAEIKEGQQTVSIDMTANRFTPAVIVVQKDINTLWKINAVSIDDNNKTLLFPMYYVRIDMKEGINELYFVPEVDFDFTTINNTFYGYIKVVDDINNVDINAIKAEVSKFIPAIQEVIDDNGLPSCH